MASENSEGIFTHIKEIEQTSSSLVVTAKSTKQSSGYHRWLHMASIPHEYRTCAVAKRVRNADDACNDYGILALQFMLIYMRDGLQ